MDFEIISGIRYSESIVQGTGIRELPRLQKIYGKGCWRNCKGEATIRLADGTILTAEVHWLRHMG